MNAAAQECSPYSGSEMMKKPARDPIREDGIHNEAIGAWHYWVAQG